MIAPDYRNRMKQRLAAGFTMIEIAISVAIVGFALVAVIGVLPAGMNTQRDNREETMVNQDAQYLIEALTHGIKRNGYLSNVVSQIEWRDTNDVTRFTFNGPFYNEQAIGLLSVRHGFRTNGFEIGSVRAVMRSMNGSVTLGWSAVDTNSQDLALWYDVSVQIQPSTTARAAMGDFVPGLQSDAMRDGLRANLHELRVTFRWPSNPDGSIVGQNRLTLRSNIAGEVVEAGMFDGTQLFSIRPYTLRKP